MARTHGGYGPSNIVLGHRLDAHAALRTGSPVPPAWVRDRIAERTITGGFRTSRKHQCPKCFLQMPVNGQCCDRG